MGGSERGERIWVRKGCKCDVFVKGKGLSTKESRTCVGSDLIFEKWSQSQKTFSLRLVHVELD